MFNTKKLNDLLNRIALLEAELKKRTESRVYENPPVYSLWGSPYKCIDVSVLEQLAQIREHLGLKLTYSPGVAAKATLVAIKKAK